MSEERIIPYADLSQIEWDLKNIHDNVATVHSEIAGVSADVASIEDRLETLARQFTDFVERDIRDKALQIAHTLLIQIRQELDQKYGHYETVRRHTTGILQATDIKLVRQEAITTAAEELMLATPRYWLAPALVSVAAWLDDNKDLAERATAEAVKRDVNKAALYYALLSRRMGRLGATAAWLDHARPNGAG